MDLHPRLKRFHLLPCSQLMPRLAVFFPTTIGDIQPAACVSSSTPPQSCKPRMLQQRSELYIPSTPALRTVGEARSAANWVRFPCHTSWHLYRCLAAPFPLARRPLDPVRLLTCTTLPRFRLHPNILLSPTKGIQALWRSCSTTTVAFLENLERAFPIEVSR